MPAAIIDCRLCHYFTPSFIFAAASRLARHDAAAAFRQLMPLIALRYYFCHLITPRHTPCFRWLHCR